MQGEQRPDAAGDQRHQGDDWPPGETPREPGVRDQPAPLREGGGHGRCGEKGAGGETNRIGHSFFVILSCAAIIIVLLDAFDRETCL